MLSERLKAGSFADHHKRRFVECLLAELVMLKQI